MCSLKTLPSDICGSLAARATSPVADAPLVICRTLARALVQLLNETLPFEHSTAQRAYESLKLNGFMISDVTLGRLLLITPA